MGHETWWGARLDGRVGEVGDVNGCAGGAWRVTKSLEGEGWTVAYGWVPSPAEQVILP